MTWKLYQNAKKFASIKRKEIVIDEYVFKLHYRFTTFILFFCVLLITSQQFIGKHIDCVTQASTKVDRKVVNTFCYFQNTFTVVYNETEFRERPPFPKYGIKTHSNSDEIVVHTYYQWVPYVLFLQALAFYVPHFIWKRLEHDFLLTTVKKIKKWDIEGKGKTKVEKAVKIFMFRLGRYKKWSYGMMQCQVLNFLNICLQFYLTNKFLVGNFYNLGSIYWHNTKFGKFSVLDVVFPKLTKCTFWKYGQTGSLQDHDAMCVMAENIINEKVFIFLWYWYILLMVATLGIIIMYAVCMIKYSQKRHMFFKYLFAYISNGRFEDENITKVILEKLSYSEWMFLYWVGFNIDGFMFQRFVQSLHLKLLEQKPADAIKSIGGNNELQNNKSDKYEVEKEKPKNDNENCKENPESISRKVSTCPLEIRSARPLGQDQGQNNARDSETPKQVAEELQPLLDSSPKNNKTVDEADKSSDSGDSDVTVIENPIFNKDLSDSKGK